MLHRLHRLRFFGGIVLGSLGIFQLQGQSASVALSACYAFNGNANESLHNLHGKDTNVTLVNDRHGNANGAYAFSGSVYSKITLPDTSILKKPYLSVSLWLLPQDSLSTQFIVFSKNKSGSNFEGYSLVIVNNTFHISKHCPDSSRYSTLDANTTIRPNVWQHVVSTVGTDSIKLYVNGAWVGSALSKFPIQYETGKHFVVGGTGESFNYPFKGNIDNMRFYNRELTALEVSQLYQESVECALSTGLTKLTENESPGIFPNPCNTVLKLNNLVNALQSTLEIYDATGRLVQRVSPSTSDFELDVSKLASGMYLLYQINGQGTSVTRFVKQ